MEFTRPSKQKFVYRNEYYPIYFTKPDDATLRHFHRNFNRLVLKFYNRIRKNPTLLENHNCIVGSGITIGELSLLLLRKSRMKNFKL